MYKISDDEYRALREWVHHYINNVCIVRNTPMPGKVPGSRYTWMFYLRRGLFKKKFNNAVSQMFIYKMEREIDSNFDFQLSGLETAATPMLIGLPYVASAFDIELNSFVVRKEQKEYGLKNWIEGIPNEKKVLLIDDLCNSSASMGKAYKVLTEIGFEVLPYALTIVNKSNKKIHTEQRLKSDMYLPEHVNVISLFNLDDFNLYSPSH
jgi:orotate phosphoribosyltransferase